jgi:2,3-diketo-5-methylthio-1-phosphopentane phosphatase
VFNIVCGFDRTIAVTDVVDHLFNEFAGPERQLIERDRIEGRISARDYLARQTALLRAHQHELTRFFHSVEIDRVFPIFAEFCASRHLPLLIISDGFDLAIRQILARHGLGHLLIIANHLEQRALNRWQVTFPYGSPYCRTGGGVCKCKIANGGAKPVILIGDGRSNTCLARQADLVLAKGYLADYCVTQRIPYLQISGFADALLVLQQLLSHPWHATDTGVRYH